MSEKEKNNIPKEENLKVDDAEKAAAVDEKEASKKVAKAAKGSKKSKKSGNNKGKVSRFFKDFKGESKKIVWPDAKMVLKSTGVVILVVAICGLAIFGIDWLLTTGVKGLKNLATVDETTTVVETTVDDAEGKNETTVGAAATTAESTTAESTTAESTTAESTTAESTTAESTTTGVVSETTETTAA